MKRQLTILALTALAAMSVISSTFAGSSIQGSDLSQELARARAATDKYHDVNVALADGYVPDMCNDEGCHYFNWDNYDRTFDPEHPEALIYRQTKNGGLRLVAVEYIVHGNDDINDPPPPAPEGFTGPADDAFWRFNTEGYADWELTTWIWFRNPNGMFAMENPRLEEAEEGN